MRLKGKTAVITGALGGIGQSITEKFSSEGAQLLLVDIDEEKLVHLKEKVKSSHPINIITADVSKPEGWKKITGTLDQEFKELHVLVNNAGISGTEGLLDTDFHRWEHVINTNLRSVYLGMHELLPKMIEAGGGSVINISSIFAIIGSGKNAAYTAAKSGMMGLTKTTAVEYAPNYVRVNTIHPGIIKTPMTKYKLENKEIYNQFHAFTPWPHFGEPEDIAYGAVYLASDESRFITGTELVIDGGYVIQ
ncbi:SDR family NAD(P)-dependent oxidoreductase [Salibacterium aidingense]|uniref:SDR family NAD(P)-dependent oxidoreductase n=1 Tax=Salibacterium aidingense TaxID=384933 RepID=UPI003BCB1890